MANSEDHNKLPGYDIPEDLKPWEQQPSESGKAYHAFTIFRDMPRQDRSIVQAAREFYGRELRNEDVPPSFRAWGEEYYWYARVRAWDRWIEEAKTNAMRDARVQKAREKGYDIESVESTHFEASTALGEKIIDAANNLKVANPDWRDVTGAAKVLSEMMVNIYKINKYKMDGEVDTSGGLSDEERERYYGEKKSPNQEEAERRGVPAE